MILSSACSGLHPCRDQLHLTLLYVRNGTLQMIIRRDLRDDHQKVESAVVEVLRAAGGRRGQPGVGLTAQSLHVCRFHQGSHPVSLPPRFLSLLCVPCARPAASSLLFAAETGALSRHASGALIGVARAFYTSRHCVIVANRGERRAPGFFFFFFKYSFCTYSTTDVIRNESNAAGSHRGSMSLYYDVTCYSVYRKL